MSDEQRSTRWQREAGGRADAFDQRWQQLAAQGENIHGEADFVELLGPRSVLDAGCGTGRVAIELGRRGLDVAGVDLDPSMLDQARGKAPTIPWVRADLSTLDLGRRFDAVVMAGNVMIYLAQGSEGSVLKTMARHLEPGGILIAGFQLEPRRLDLATFDSLASEAGLVLAERFATWDREPFTGGNYAVSVHRLSAERPG